MASPADLTAESIASAVPVLVDGVELHQQDEQALIRLFSAPIQRRQPFRWLARVFKLPNRVSIELDDIGSWVVQRLGQQNLRSLAEELAKDWKLTKREAESALTVFIRALLNRRLVRLQWTEDQP